MTQHTNFIATLPFSIKMEIVFFRAQAPHIHQQQQSSIHCENALLSGRPLRFLFYFCHYYCCTFIIKYCMPNFVRLCTWETRKRLTNIISLLGIIILLWSCSRWTLIDKGHWKHITHWMCSFYRNKKKSKKHYKLH